MLPDHMYALFGVECFDNLGDAGLSQPHHSAHDAAEFKKLTACIALGFEFFVESHGVRS